MKGRNSDHQFYRFFIEKNIDNPDVIFPIYVLVYSLSNAELISGAGFTLIPKITLNKKHPHMLLSSWWGNCERTIRIKSKSLGAFC